MQVNAGGVASARPARASPGLAFRSRPDLLPPKVTATGVAAAPPPPSEGYLFLAPTSSGGAQPGALVVDTSGEPVWFRPTTGGRLSSNLRVQQFRGAPVLTWWEGKVLASGYGLGEGLIVDTSYREIARVRAGEGRHLDLHEFLLTPEGTALVTCYPRSAPADLSRIGGARNGRVLESIIQEIDIASGRVVFEWRSLDHVPVSESYVSPVGDFDYLHANSIDLAPDGNLLVSARHTWAVYKLERRTGRVMWRLGGKRTEFRMGPGTRFAWQHDARHLSPGRITLFDDGAGPRRTHSESRGIVLAVDEGHRSVELAQAYRHPQPLLAYAMGNMQALSDGNIVVGWGNVPVVSEFAASGSLLTDMWLPWGHNSYRGYRFAWSGVPDDPPAVATSVDSGGGVILYASWNGATDVAGWQVSLGPAPTAMSLAATAQRTGFETAIALGAASGYAVATAVDSAGQPLASSRPIAL